MAYKVHDAVKRNIKEKFKDAVNGYLLELCNMWELDPANGWFVGDEVGDVWCYGDNIFIGFNDMRYCVDNNISLDTFNEWSDYCSWANEFNQSIPNLKSWCLGCPRVPKETQEHLNLLKKNFESAIAETKEKF